MKDRDYLHDIIPFYISFYCHMKYSIDASNSPILTDNQVTGSFFGGHVTS